MLGLIYGLASYVVFLVSIAYLAGFAAGVGVPKSVDSGNAVRAVEALVIDTLLMTLFAIQHSVMARQGFKAWWRRSIPAAYERITYVLLSSLLLDLLFWLWRPMPAVVWSVESSAGLTLALYGIAAAGWLVTLIAALEIGIWDVFGLRQVILEFRRRPYRPLEFKMPALYRWVRHPIYTGTLAAFWSAPVMTQGHLLFNVLATGYVLIGIQFEERDLARSHGQVYRDYQRRVPSLLPIPRRHP